MKAILRLIAGPVTTVLLWLIIWRTFGAFKVTATFESSPIDGAPVYIDGVRVGKTPYTVFLTPGQHTIGVKPPDDYETTEGEIRAQIFTIALGGDVPARFTARPPSP